MGQDVHENGLTARALTLMTTSPPPAEGKSAGPTRSGVPALSSHAAWFVGGIEVG